MHDAMALPTMDRAEPLGLPVDHSVDAHIEAERAALARERAAANAAPADERWRLIRSVGLGLALAGTIAIGWNHLDQPAPKPTTCAATSSAPGGRTDLHRDPAQGCAWVDAEGSVVDAGANP